MFDYSGFLWLATHALVIGGHLAPMIQSLRVNTFVEQNAFQRASIVVLLLLLK